MVHLLVVLSLVAAATTVAPVLAAPVSEGSPSPVTPLEPTVATPAPVETPAPVPAPAVAAPAAPAPIPIAVATAAPPKPVARGWHEHDGFYMRFGLGFTAFGDTLTSSFHEDMHEQGTVRGFGTASEFALGGTVGAGFVLGGGVYGTSVVTSSYVAGTGRVPPMGLRQPDSFTIIGLFADWYFRPRGGLHVQAALGAAVLSGVAPDRMQWDDREAASGGGAMLGIGHEWWVDAEWGVGILGRVTGGVAVQEVEGERWYHLAGASPSVLFTATYH